MDEQRFMRACGLRDEGKLDEAARELLTLAEDTADPIDKAGVLINAATTLAASGKFEAALRELRSVIELANKIREKNEGTTVDERPAWLMVTSAFEQARIFEAEGRKDEALAKYLEVESRFPALLSREDYRDTYQAVRSRRAFLLVDLGRWWDALPILEEAESFQRQRELIKFYLGHTYITAKEYAKGIEKLKESLKMGLPRHLEPRAHWLLGIAYHKLEYYAQAKVEFEEYAERIDPSYIPPAELWHWLDLTCQHLNLWDEAKHYAQLTKSS